MIKIYPGLKLTNPVSDLYIEINNVRYIGKDYIKVKASLKYKTGIYKGFVVESKNYKLYYSNIEHLRVYND
jgi:hypothetical protein